MDSVNPQPPSMPMSAGLGLKVYRFRSLIRRRWWIMALTIGLGLAVEGYLLLTKPPMFESSSQLIFREELTPGGIGSGAFQDNHSDNDFGTVIEMLKSDMVTQAAKSELALESPGETAKVDLTSSVAARTNIFTVTGTGPNGEYTRRYVDAVVKQFKAVRRKNRDSTVVEMRDGMKDQLTELKTELAKQQADFQNFIKTNNMAFWQEQAKSSALFLSGLKNQQAQLLNELQRLQNLTPDELLATPMAVTPKAQAQPGMPATGTNQQPTAYNTELYVQYTQETQKLIQEQAALEQWKLVWKPKHPKLQALQSKVEETQRLLDTIRKQNAEATAGRIDSIKAELKSLESSIANWEKKVLEASAKDAEYQTCRALWPAPRGSWKSSSVAPARPIRNSPRPTRSWSCTRPRRQSPFRPAPSSISSSASSAASLSA
jgi:uncharacterized protein involved in exopolysaccharide biosynthesis